MGTHEAELDRVFAVDLKGVALCLKYETAEMMRQNIKGSIVNIASCSAFRPQPRNSAYVAAKHGVVGLTQGCGAGLRSAPDSGQRRGTGAIETPMLRRRRRSSGRAQTKTWPPLTLFNRFGKPVEVAQASLWLASDLRPTSPASHCQWMRGSSIVESTAGLAHALASLKCAAGLQFRPGESDER